MVSMSRREKAILITLLIFFVYYQTPPIFSNRYLCITYSIVDRHSFDIDPYTKDVPSDKSYYGGHYYTAANPGLSFFAVPVYAALKPFENLTSSPAMASNELNHFVINVLINNLLTCLLALMFFRALAFFGLDERRRAFLTLALGLGTIIFCYSLEYFAASTIGTFFAFAAFYLLLFRNGSPEYASPPPARVFISGLCCGACVLVGYEFAPFVALFGLYLLSRVRFMRLLYFAPGFLIPALALLAYQKACFGGWFTPYTAHMVESRYTAIVQHGHMGFSGLDPRVLFELALGPRRGYFSFMPVMLLPVAGLLIYLIKLAKKQVFEKIKTSLPNRALRETIFCAAVFLGYLLLFASSQYWESGTSFGQRYLVVTIPFFLLLSSFAFERIPMWIAAVPALLSFLVNWAGAQYFKYFFNTQTADGFVADLFRNGLTSFTTRQFVNSLGPQYGPTYSQTVTLVNAAFLLLIGIYLWLLWTKYAKDKSECRM